MSDPMDLAVKSALTAYWRFLDTWSSGDAGEFSASLNFPHLRVPGHASPCLAGNVEEYSRTVEFPRTPVDDRGSAVAAEPTVVDVSLSKVHVLGGWERRGIDGELLDVDAVALVVTFADGDWRVQGIFGVDGAGDGEPSAATDRQLLALVEAGFASLAEGGADEWFHSPCYVVDPGDVRAMAGSPAIRSHFGPSGLAVTGSRLLQRGQLAATVALSATLDDREVSGIVVVTRRADRWGIEGASLIVR